MRRLLLPLLCALALAASAPAAHAAIVPGQSIDGPSADVKSFQDVDLAPDGTGALAYIKAVGGVNHVFVSTLANGQWSPGVRVDPALPAAGKYARVAAGNGGRVVVTFITGNGAYGIVHSAIRASTGAAFTNSSVQGLSIATIAELEMDPASGVAYSVYNDTNQGGGGSDLYASRLTGTTWTGVGGNYNEAGAKLDNDPTKGAGIDGQRGPRVVVDSAGNALVVWSEDGAVVGNYSVWGRKLTGTTRGAQVEANLATVPGSDGTAGTADMVDVAVAGSGPAWVVFRQLFKYGAANVPHGIARTFDGAAFGAGQVTDGLPSGNVPGAEFPRVAVNAAGRGFIAAARQDQNKPGENDVLGSTLAGGNWATGARVDFKDNADSVPTPVVAVGDDGAGLWAWHERDGANIEVRVRQRTAANALSGETVVSVPAFGTAADVDLETSADAAGHVAVGFAQGAAATKRIVVALVDPIPVPGGGGGGGGGGGTDKTAPKITSLSLSAATFRLGTLLTQLAATKKPTPTGTTIRFRVDEQTTTALSFKRVLPGRKVGKRCLAATRARRRRSKCTRLVAVNPTLKFATKAGLNTIRFQGRLTSRRKLAPGRYELTLVATDAAKNVSKPARKRFTLKAALRPKRRQ